MRATPNPFVNRTLLEYSFYGNDTVTISVLNPLGQTILYVFYNVIKPAGAYQDSLLMDAYPPGIYFVNLRLGHRASKTLKIVKQGPTLLAELSPSNLLMIYPNPFCREITLVLQVSALPLGFTIYDTLGQVIYTQHEPDVLNKLDLGFLEKGIYILNIHAEGLQKSIKLVKE